ncbi:MAG: hypothetical protein LIP10_13145 [Clostridiales bacterium]|nr:hypothetical protein [Clostridiales bacterium]
MKIWRKEEERAEQTKIRNISRKELDEMIHTLPDGRMLLIHLDKEGSGDG